MKRIVYLGALVAIALLPAIAPAQKSATVEQVRVRGNGDALEVEIQTSGAPVAPNTQALSSPNRIVVDFPGALPSAELRAIAVNRGNLKAIRAGLFFKNPPITRIVLDLGGAQPYRIATEGSAVVVKLDAAAAEAKPAVGAEVRGSARLHDVSLVAAPGAQAKLAATSMSAGVAASSSPGVAASATAGVAIPARAMATPGAQAAASEIPAVSDPAVAAVPAEPSKPVVTVSYENGMLRIHAEKATLSQVLYEVQRKTGAEIAIPAGAEEEQVVADFGPGPARDVLGSLLDGSPYNFIFVGNELALEKVILTRRQIVF